ncbi:MAG: hypothetical protein LBD18_05390 [Treponema sp.]|nr:hypothetical protein [Treponema sp.]
MTFSRSGGAQGLNTFLTAMKGGALNPFGMNKKIAFFVLGFAALITLGIFAYTLLEIYPRKQPVFPTREAIANPYLALDRWLSETGRPVRIERRSSVSDIAFGAEKAVVVYASLCDWEDSLTMLLPWIQQGGFLYIALEDSFYDENLAEFLACFGFSAAGDSDDDRAGGGAEDDDKPESPVEETPVPDFDSDIALAVTEAANSAAGIEVLKDRYGVIRLARAALGAGGLALGGKPYFMFTGYLNRDINARLAWDLTGARAKDAGVLFVRGKSGGRGLLGNIADRGNIIPLAVSVAILVVIGFWMVIPVFGLVFYGRQPKAKPIQERFLAEISFLKKYGALEYYLQVYLHELQLKPDSIKKESGLAEIEQALQGRRGLKYRDLIKSLKKLESKMERL